MTAISPYIGHPLSATLPALENLPLGLIPPLSSGSVGPQQLIPYYLVQSVGIFSVQDFPYPPPGGMCLYTVVPQCEDFKYLQFVI